MGMLDSIYDANGDEWQTKAFGCSLRCWKVGGPLDEAEGGSFQVEVLGGPFAPIGEESRIVDGLATVRAGVIEAVPADRDYSLPLMNYSGHVIDWGNRRLTAAPTQPTGGGGESGQS